MGFLRALPLINFGKMPIETPRFEEWYDGDGWPWSWKMHNY